MDFVYTYGPATIILNYAWARLLGNHWQSFFALFAMLQLALAVSLALLPYSLRIPRIASIACILALLPFLRFEFSIAHLTEKIFLVNAALFVAHGRYSAALAFCTASALFRPSSGLVAGALVLLGVAWPTVRTRAFFSACRALVVTSTLSVIVLVGMGGIYAVWLGARSLLITVLPFSGSKLYDSPSIIAPLRDLLPRFLPEGQNLFGYLGANPTHAPLFAIGGVFLFGFIYAASDKSSDRINAVALMAYTLIALFFVTFSGGVFYLYYVPILWVGLLAIAMTPRILPALQWPCLIVLSAIVTSLVTSTIYRTPSIARKWTALVQHDFGELAVPAELEADVKMIRRWAPTGAVSAMPLMGDVALLRAIGLTSPRLPYWCFRNRGFNLEPELQAAEKQMKRNPWIVVRINQAEHFPFHDRVEHMYHGRYLSLLKVK